MERSSYHEGGRKPCEQGAKRPKASENSVVLRSRRVPASSNPAKNNPQLWTACSVSGRNAQIGDIPRRFSEVTESDSVLEFLVGANRLNVGSTWRKRRISAPFSLFILLAPERPLLLANSCRRGLCFHFHSCAIHTSSISCD